MSLQRGMTKLYLETNKNINMQIIYIGESWGMANDGEWRTGQYLVEGVKAIKCFHPRMLISLMTRVNSNSMELSYHSLSWYLQKSLFEKN